MCDNDFESDEFEPEPDIDEAEQCEFEEALLGLELMGSAILATLKHWEGPIPAGVLAAVGGPFAGE